MDRSAVEKAMDPHGTIRLAAKWADVCTDPRVARVAVVKQRDDRVAMFVSVRQPAHPIPRTTEFRGTFGECVGLAGAFVETLDG